MGPTNNTNYKEDQQVALWNYWHDNGQKQEEGIIKDGTRDGLWTSWYNNGQKRSEETIQDGLTEVWINWSPDGQDSSKLLIKDSIPDGEYKWWSKEGALLYETEFVNGTGILKIFDIETELEYEETTYKDGKIIEFKFWDYEYDLNGNLTMKTEFNRDIVTTWTYYRNGQMKKESITTRIDEDESGVIRSTTISEKEWNEDGSVKE